MCVCVMCVYFITEDKPSFFFPSQSQENSLKIEKKIFGGCPVSRCSRMIKDSGALQILSEPSSLGSPKMLKSPCKGDEERRDPLFIAGEQWLSRWIQGMLPTNEEERLPLWSN